MFRKYIYYWIIGGVIVLSLVVAIIWKRVVSPQPTVALPQEKKIKVVTTILPLYLAAREAGGSLVEVENIIPLDEQPWNASLTEEETQKLQDADIFIRTATPIDAWAEGLTASYPEVDEVVMGDELKLLPSLPLLSGGEEGAEKDSYFWLDTGRMLNVVSRIRDAMIEREPQKLQIYWEQTSAFLEAVGMIDRDFRERFKGVQSRAVVTSRDFLTYFISSFDLDWIGAGVMRPGELPNNAHTAALRRSMSARGVNVMFAAPDDAWAQAFAADAGVTVFQFDPMEFTTSADITYDAIMRKNMRNMSEALEYIPELE